MAGQSVGLICDTKPVREIVTTLVRDAEQTFNNLGL